MINTSDVLEKLTPFERATLDAVPLRVQVVMRSDARKAQKYIRLVQIADHANAAAMPHTPCKKGCAHCCKIPVAITKREAKNIEKVTARKFARVLCNELPEVTMERLRGNIAKYTGVPCPFLGAQNECTIYEVRPLACRTYHSLNATADQCDTTKHPGAKVPRFNFESVSFAAVSIDLTESFGDIREFFPP